MTYRWSVDDMVARIEFVRDHSPQDLFTMIARYVVSIITSVLAVVLHPITVIIKFISRILRIFVLTLVLFMILDVVWLLMWGLLMGSSRLWIMYHWLRPIFILPGILIAIFAHLYIVVAPDPEKNPEYWKVVREWPLSWHIWKPTDAYFAEHGES